MRVGRGRGLVGRGRVVEQLGGAIDEAVAGRGQVVLVTGDAGIGKTAVAAEAAAWARDRGARMLWAACWEGDGVPGYWPWVQVVRRLAAEPGRLADAGALARLVSAPDRPGAAPGPAGPDGDRFQLFDELSSLLLAEADAGPVVVVLDDLHWADPPSLSLPAFLARRLPGAPVLVVGPPVNAGRACARSRACCGPRAGPGRRARRHGRRGTSAPPRDPRRPARAAPTTAP